MTMNVEGADQEQYEINIVSPPQFDDVVAEVETSSGTVFYMYEDRSRAERFRIEIVPREDGRAWDVDLETFRKLLELASARLVSMDIERPERQ
jgi:hypothetical protein